MCESILSGLHCQICQVRATQADQILSIVPAFTELIEFSCLSHLKTVCEKTRGSAKFFLKTYEVEDLFLIL